MITFHLHALVWNHHLQIYEFVLAMICFIHFLCPVSVLKNVKIPYNSNSIEWLIKTTSFDFADEQDEEAVTTGGKVKKIM